MRRIYLPCAWWKKMEWHSARYVVSICAVYVKHKSDKGQDNCGRLGMRGLSKELFRRGSMCRGYAGNVWRFRLWMILRRIRRRGCG